MANDLLNELTRNLANAEETGNVEWATALKVRIAELEKPAKAPAAAPVPKPKPAKPTVTKAKKATKATKSRKR